MKMLILLLLLVISTIETVCAQFDTWQRVAVGDSTTVDFPSKPKKIIHKGEDAYGLYEEGVLYSIAIQENAKEADLTVEEKRGFYEEAMQGAAKTVKASEITNKARFEINGFEGLEATIISTIDKVKNPVIMRMILVNGTFYGQMFSASASPAHTAARQHFFASFTPRLRPVAATPAETRSTPYKFGQLLGQLLVYGGIIAGIIFLLARLIVKKKHA